MLKQNTNAPAPSLDSLFYKKGGQNQTLLKDSNFLKKRLGQLPCDEAELQKYLSAFEYDQVCQRLIQDKPFKNHLTQSLLRIQNLLGKSFLRESTIDEQFFFDGNLFSFSCIPSIIKAFRLYRESLQQFSLYACNSKIDQINQYFNLFWFLTLRIIKSPDQQKRDDLTAKIREEVSFIINQLNIMEFMSIKSFEHQTTILLHLLMIVNLIQQETPLEPNSEASHSQQTQFEDFAKFLLYLLHWVSFTLFAVAFSIKGGFDQARSIMKKELVDSMVIVHLMVKAFDRAQLEAAFQNVVKAIHVHSVSQETLAPANVSESTRIAFSEWKKEGKQPFYQLKSNSEVVSLDLALSVLLLTNLSYQYSHQELIGKGEESLIDWKLLGSLLKTEFTLKPSLTRLSLKYLSVLLKLSTKSQANSLMHEQFLMLLQISFQGEKAQAKQGLKQQKDSLNRIIKLYQDQECSKQVQSSDFLEIYLRTQDQRQLKQLYQKVLSLAQAIPKTSFLAQSTFMRYIENSGQSLIIWKKCLALAQSESQKQDVDINWLSQMLLILGGSLKYIECQDKSEQFEAINSLIKRVVELFITTVLKNKANLNANEYLLKIEMFLENLSLIFSGLCEFYKPLKGIWKSGECQLGIDQQLAEDLFSIYSFLSVKPAQVEQLYQSYSKLCCIWMKKKNTPNLNQQGISDSLGATSDDILDACEDLIGDQLVIEKRDKLFASQLRKINFRAIIERWIKSYMTSGKEIDTLVSLFKLSGAIDGILIEQKEMPVTQILQKVQANKYTAINDSLDNIQKQMTIAMLINTYTAQIINRIGIYFILGLDNSTLFISDPQATGQLTEIAYNLLQSLIRGLLILSKPLNGGDSRKQSIKMLKLIQQHNRVVNKEVLFVFREAKLESQLFEAFLTQQVSKRESSYNLVVEIFYKFFQQVQEDQLIQTETAAKILHNYVALIPLLCKQFADFVSANQTHPQNHSIQEYLQFLKRILLQFMVTFQDQSYFSNLISQIVNLVMPSFFGTTTQQKTGDISDSQDAFYFFQYIKLQHNSVNTEDYVQERNSRSNMKKFTDLILREIEVNLNQLIPNLLFVQPSQLGNMIKYIRETCPVMKPLLDQMSEVIEKEDPFIEALFRQCSGMMRVNDLRSESDIRFTHRKILELILLNMMLIARRPKSSSLVRAGVFLVSLLIEELFLDIKRGKINPKSMLSEEVNDI